MKSLTMKSQGLSLQTIVLAALALFVLVVMIMIFANKAKPASDFYGDCEGLQLNGTVVKITEDCDEVTNGDKPYSSPFVRTDDEKCCVKNFIN